MARKQSEKEEKATAKKTVVENAVSEKEEIVNIEKQDENQNDVSEVVKNDNAELDNVEKVENEAESLNDVVPEQETLNEKSDTATVQQSLNEVVSDKPEQEKKLNEEFSGQVDGPIVEGDLSDNGASFDVPSFSQPTLSGFFEAPASRVKSFVASLPAEATYEPDGSVPVYTAQCPPKPVEENKAAYVAQRPY